LNPHRTRTGDAAAEDSPGGVDAQIGKINHEKQSSSLRLQKPIALTKDKPVDLLESFFEESLRPQSSRNHSTPSRPKIATLETFQAVESVRNMLEDGKTPTVEIWQFFITNLGPETWIDGSSPRPSSFNMYANLLLQRLITERRNQPGYPTAGAIAMMFAALGRLQLKNWRLLLEELLQDLSPKPQIDNVIKKDHDSNRDQTIQDILELWRVFFVSRGLNIVPDGQLLKNASDWSFMPQSDELNLPNPRPRSGLESSFRYFLRRPSSPAQLKGITSCAFVTFAILGQDECANGVGKFADHPFMTNLTRVLVNSRAGPGELAALIQGDPISASGGHNLDWTQVLERARKSSTDQTGSKTEIAGISGSLIRRPSRIGSWSCPTQRKLTQCLAEKDLQQVNRLWIAVSEPQRGKDSTAGNIPTDSIALSQELYDRFIFVYMGLRQPNRAIEVWNAMISNSLTPTPKTWNAMLEGCKTSRDPAALEGVWAKMISSGVQPDMECWTTRISGLAESGKPDRAIKALEEMGRLWVQAAKTTKVEQLQQLGDIGGVIKPTIETINAAIAGLLRRKQSDVAQRVLAWGGRLGIQPDMITFNTLLRSLTREGRTKEVQKLLRHMELMGLNADVATFTTILDEAFRGAEHMTTKEQKDVVKEVFEEMDAAGIKANHFTYGTIIYSLLKSPSNDMTALQSVLSRMSSEGLTPSPQIYTSLIDHHFDRDQPDLEVIRSLLEQIRLSGMVMDHVFWDRVIEGYSRVRDTTNALRYLGKADREGSRVGFWALNTVISALAENEEWDLAKQVVRNVRTDRGEPPPLERKGTDGEHAFWQTAASLDLIEG